MPLQTVEYKNCSLFPAQVGAQWTVLIRPQDQVLCHPEVAKSETYSEAIWQAQRIVDRICTPAG